RFVSPISPRLSGRRTPEEFMHVSRRSLDVRPSPDLRRARRARTAALLALGLAFPALAPAARANHKDDRLGFTIPPPNKWTSIPISGDDRWMVAKYLSDKTYFWTDKKGGWTQEHQPDMEFVAFVDAAVKEKARLVPKEGRNGRVSWLA